MSQALHNSLESNSSGTKKEDEYDYSQRDGRRQPDHKSIRSVSWCTGENEIAGTKSLRDKKKSAIDSNRIIKDSSKPGKNNRDTPAGDELQDLGRGLLSELICPMCEMYMVPPITLCGRGHNICFECKKKVEYCPTCQDPFLETRNIALENLTQQVMYPCKYAGCPEMYPVGQILDHQGDCQYGPYECPIVEVGDVPCAWMGPLHLMREHIGREHKNDFSEGTGVKNLTRVKENGLWDLAIFYMDEIFYRRFGHIDGDFYGYVKYIGPRERAKLYKYELSLLKKGSVERISACHMTQPRTASPREIYESGKCLRLHWDVMKQFVDENCKLRTDIKISKVSP